MTGFLILATWTVVGVAAALTDRDEQRWHSVPMAIFLGPFWIAVRGDRQLLARTPPSATATTDETPSRPGAWLSSATTSR